jgi:hypothetical protein
MNIKQHIAHHLVEVHRGGNWTDVSITHTLKDVSRQQALTITPFSPNSIAMLLHHITYWNSIVALRGQNIEPEINEQNGMNAPALNSDEDWEELKQDNIHSAEELATIIEGYDIGSLYNPILPGHSSAYKNFQGQVEHVHYHLGQIVMIKKYIQDTAS